MTVTTAAGVCLLTAAGTLDSSTYLELRDCVIRAALAEPPAVVIDVSRLDVPASSAWSVFTSAHWHVSTWPAVPILLVCPRSDVAATLANAGVTRHLSVHSDVESAVASLAQEPLPRRRVHALLPHRVSSLRGSREFVAEWLTNWSLELLIPAAQVIVDVLVENVLRHTDSPVVVALESTSATITIAVHDTSETPAIRHELPTGGADRASGLAVVGALSRAWGSNPAPNGKTVWAVLGPENRL
ncbi:STAS domain-containing protein [Mycobacterium sp. UM_Kg1]|uniref:STAS domain-containing protein n=1 Tax=Mycobacterium sp. UM_Kg1 TaxID=1545691 RepID=UPI0009E4AEEB|nr:STAS domain-containing protein [Mycobacterium sp. UM_Kg1]